MFLSKNVEFHCLTDSEKSLNEYERLKDSRIIIWTSDVSALNMPDILIDQDSGIHILIYFYAPIGLQTE